MTRTILHLNFPPTQQRAIMCVGGCGEHFFPKNPQDQICEKQACADRVAAWTASRKRA